MAAKLQCEICGGKLVGKPGGVFECENCGTEFSTEWAQTKIHEITGKVQIEGTVEVTGKVQVEGGTVQVDASAQKNALLKRVYMFLEDGAWKSANEYCEKLLDYDPENAEAYLTKLMAELRLSQRGLLAYHDQPLDGNINYRKAMRYADDPLKEELEGYNQRIHSRIIQHHQELARIRNINRHVKGLISAGSLNTVCVDTRGNACAIGDHSSGRCDVSNWQSIIAVSAGINHTVGVRTDGTVVSTPLRRGKDFGQCAVNTWRNIISASASLNNTVGLQIDGTVVALGDNSHGQCNVSQWNDVIEISSAVLTTIGLKADGTVVIAGESGYRRNNVSEWEDIVSISAGSDHILGLRSDGTVVAVGSNASGQCEVSSWRNIVAISAGTFHTVGLCADGTVVSTAFKGKSGDDFGQCNVGTWRNVVAISAGRRHTVGLCTDGTVISTRLIGDQSKNYGQCDVFGLKLFDDGELLLKDRER